MLRCEQPAPGQSSRERARVWARCVLSWSSLMTSSTLLGLEGPAQPFPCPPCPLGAEGTNSIQQDAGSTRDLAGLLGCARLAGPVSPEPAEGTEERSRLEKIPLTPPKGLYFRYKPSKDSEFMTFTSNRLFPPVI